MMATYKILIPSGIGDFSWTWSKLICTPHNFHLEYIGGYPDRMKAFFDLLPKDRLLSCTPNSQYYTRWDEKNELVCCARQGAPAIRKAYRLSDLREGEMMFIESNSYLEAGNRLEGWLADELPNTEFHYPLNGTIKGAKKGDYFIVNYSSYGTKKNWNYYDVPDSVEFVKFVQKFTGWTPIFIGGEYDDYTVDIFRALSDSGVPAISLIGKTPELVTVVALLQQAKMYVGACSGLMVLANILHTAVATYYPGFDVPPGRKLAGMWHDPNVPYLSLFWDGLDKNKQDMENFIKHI